MRALVALLLLANLLFFAWSQGWLDDIAGVRAEGDREPERLARQVRPEVVRVLTPQATTASVAPTATSVAAPAAAADAPRGACLEAGPFDAAAIGPAETALATTLPGGSWVRRSVEGPGRWVLYMGRFANREAQVRKEQELARLRVPFEPMAGVPDLEPGIALGRYTARDTADAALAQLAQRGIQTARVVELPPAAVHFLRVDGADPALAQRVAGLRLDALGRGFAACRS